MNKWQEASLRLKEAKMRAKAKAGANWYYWDDKVWDPQHGIITLAESEEYGRQRKIEAAIKAKRQEAKESVESWNNLGLWEPDELDKSLIEWKDNRDDEQFETDVWPHLQSLRASYSKQHVTKLHDRAKRLYMTCEQTWDHSEWLTDIMFEAIEDWNPKKMQHFSAFYKQRAVWFATDKSRRIKRGYMENMDITLMRFDEEDSISGKAETAQHTTNSRGQSYMSIYVDEFLAALTPKQKELYDCLENNIGGEKMTQEQLAESLGISRMTLHRRRAELQKLWLEYDNGGDEDGKGNG